MSRNPTWPPFGTLTTRVPKSTDCQNTDFSPLPNWSFYEPIVLNLRITMELRFLCVSL